MSEGNLTPRGAVRTVDVPQILSTKRATEKARRTPSRVTSTRAVEQPRSLSGQYPDIAGTMLIWPRPRRSVRRHYSSSRDVSNSYARPILLTSERHRASRGMTSSCFASVTRCARINLAMSALILWAVYGRFWQKGMLPHASQADSALYANLANALFATIYGKLLISQVGT